MLGQRQCEALFATEERGQVLYSSDAYFLLHLAKNVAMTGSSQYQENDVWYRYCCRYGRRAKVQLIT